MDKNTLISIFRDTQNMSLNGALKNKTEKAQQSTRVYSENFTASKSRKSDFDRNITVTAGTTFATAKRFIGLGKTAVLNFANPHFPGGGVENGAMAQEECLCRSSNLYPCLTTSEAEKNFYAYHRDLKHHFFSDRLIYTHDVTVFKTDDDAPQLMSEDAWFDVDVITCAAPYLAKRKYTNQAALRELFKQRIRNIFEAAIDNDVDVLILGAFGCGAFKNPPDLVADCFYDVLRYSNYKDFFKEIVFAIKPTDSYCPNLFAFDDLFEHEDECHLLVSPFDLKFKEIPASIKKILEKEPDFSKWMEKNQYFDKQFSILGDSISTLIGYNPHGYRVFYDDENSKKAGILQMNDTWWGQVIDFFGGNLLVNNAWSGSRVTRFPSRDSLFPSGCSDERTSALHINTIMPDVIIVYLGTNDWAYGVYPDLIDTLLDEDINNIHFSYAYDIMIEKLKNNYPAAEIWCCTFNKTFMSQKPSFTFPEKHGGIHIEKYNEIIRNVAHEKNCRLIDLYSYNVPYDAIDGSHPNADGMHTLATLMIREIGGKEVEQFIDCEDGMHKYRLIDDTRYICMCCGKTESEIPILDERYRVLQQLSSKKFLVEDIHTKKQWEMIVCDKTRKNYTDSEREYFLQKARMMMRFSHPSIPYILDIFEDKRYIGIVREYVKGITLQTILDKNGAIPADAVADWGKQLCATLSYLHNQPQPHIYRDMKPQNVIMSAGNQLHLIDFDIARVYDPKKTSDTVVLGTHGYAPPEQYGSAQTDARSDIFALGVTMFALVTGIDPRTKHFVLQPICQINPSLPKGLEYIISKCTAIDPNDRYQSCEELLYDLNNHFISPPVRKKQGLFKRKK
ncbi:MAG: TIGR02452 family protein [Ruminococcaceae bacterium]|nr:TIGR02452 family protein [Oscillospiraceae bacterium]